MSSPDDIVADLDSWNPTWRADGTGHLISAARDEIVRLREAIKTHRTGIQFHDFNGAWLSAPFNRRLWEALDE